MTKKQGFRILLIRHGKTWGNLEKRYTGGRTDDGLCPEGIKGLQDKAEDLRALAGYDPEADGLRQDGDGRWMRVISSPMRRCLETAEILFPGVEPMVMEGLREIDFGTFEGRNFEEMKEDSTYQQWVDSGGKMPFPEGETRQNFEDRTLGAFYEGIRQVLPEPDADRDADCSGTVVLTCHGGSIMVIMLHIVGGDMFTFHPDNGEGVLLEAEAGDEGINITSYALVRSA